MGNEKWFHLAPRDLESQFEIAQRTMQCTLPSIIRHSTLVISQSWWPDTKKIIVGINRIVFGSLRRQVNSLMINFRISALCNVVVASVTEKRPLRPW